MIRAADHGLTVQIRKEKGRGQIVRPKASRLASNKSNARPSSGNVLLGRRSEIHTWCSESVGKRLETAV